MSMGQGFFRELFRDQRYSPADGFEPRDWQGECLEAYQASRDTWATAHANNGTTHQHRFCLYAGTGAGKTKGVALLVADMLNRKLVGQVVFVCPNRAIKRKAARDLREVFGIDLAGFCARKHRDGIPRTKQGYILTYAHLMSNPALHRAICAPERTLVIFDEVHHLAEKNEWGGKALEAFEAVPYVITMTGTPWRTEGDCIPFVTYEPTNLEKVVRFSADPDKGTGYTYSLGRAISDGVCRKPVFVWHDGTVKIRTGPNSGETTVTFDDTKVSEAVANLRLRGAVKYGSECRRGMLESSLDATRERKGKAIIFLGGDTEGEQTPTEDATVYLPSELAELGITPDEYVVVTCNDKAAPDKLEAFGTSSAWILISINMVSEGNDIPQLTDEIFLTSVSAFQTTAQRIGRALRLMGEGDPHKDARINMFGDARMKAWAAELDSEIDVWDEINLNRRKREIAEGDGQGDGPQFRAEAIGIAGGKVASVTFGGKEYPEPLVRQKREELRRRNLPSTLLYVVVALTLDGHEHVDSTVA